MDRNTLTGFLLIGLILVTFNIFILPKDQPSAPQKAKTAVKEAPKAEIKAAGMTPAASDSVLSESLGPLAPLGNGQAQLVQLSNDKIKVTFSSKGATPVQVLVNGYKTYDGKPLSLFKSGANRLSYHYVAGNRNISTEQLYFQIDSSNSSKGSLVFTAALDEKRFIRHTYSLAQGAYLMKHQVQVVGLGGILAPNIDYTRLSWNTGAPRQERDLKDERNTSTAYFRFSDEEPERIDYTDYETKELKTAVKWVSFKQKFFNSTLIADQQFDDGKVTTILPSTDSTVKEFNAELVLPLKNPDNQVHNLSFYFGPNDYSTLKAFGLGLQEMIPLGWGIFGWVNKLIVINVFDWLDTSGLSYGLIILILTIIIKLILFPFTYKSYISSAKMRILKPEIDEMKAKYENDPTRQQAEQMKLFQRAGVSPLGGCLPLLLQLPILIAMFNFFPASIELRQQPFLWATDLSTYDSVWTFGQVPIVSFLYGDHVSLFALLMTASTLLYTHFNNQITGVTGQMKYIGYIMPVMFLGIMNNYSAGLSYYYLLANLITFGQQWMIRRFVDEDKLHAQIQENKKKPVKKSKWAARLEEMAKAQQQAAQQRQGKR